MLFAIYPPPPSLAPRRGSVSRTLGPSAARLSVKSLPTQPHGLSASVLPKAGTLLKNSGQEGSLEIVDPAVHCPVPLRELAQRPREALFGSVLTAQHTGQSREAMDRKCRTREKQGLHLTSPLAAQLWGSQHEWATFLTPCPSPHGKHWPQSPQ